MSNGLHSWVTYASNSFLLVSFLGSGVNQSERGAVLKTFSLSTLPKSSRTKQKTAVLDWKHTLPNRLIRQGTSPSWFPGIYRSYFCNSGVKKSIGIFKSVHVHRLILSPRYLQLSWAKEDRRTLLCSCIAKQFLLRCHHLPSSSVDSISKPLWAFTNSLLFNRRTIIHLIARMGASLCKQAFLRRLQEHTQVNRIIHTRWWLLKLQFSFMTINQIFAARGMKVC